jgi:hypothetical protein
MKIKHLVLAAAATIMLAACGGGSNSPKGIVESLYSALQKGDWQKAAKIELEHSKEFYDPIAQSKEAKEWALQYISSEMQKYAEKHQGGSIESFKITEEKEYQQGNGNYLSFTLSVVGKNGVSDTHYVNIGKYHNGKLLDNWLIDSDDTDNWRDH